MLNCPQDYVSTLPAMMDDLFWRRRTNLRTSRKLYHRRLAWLTVARSSVDLMTTRALIESACRTVSGAKVNWISVCRRCKPARSCRRYQKNKPPSTEWQSSSAPTMPPLIIPGNAWQMLVGVLNGGDFSAFHQNCESATFIVFPAAAGMPSA